VIANLLNNSAKYQDVRGVIDLTVEEVGGTALIRVRDQGIGIAPELLGEIFVLFAQGERAPDLAQGGLGIGLSLVRSLVELHGGTVHAHSEGLGSGAEFVVTLPRIPDDVGVMRVDAAAPALAPVLSAPTRILVVDDNTDAAASLAQVLRMSGHDVIVAHDGRRALELVATELPSVLLLDIGLPGLDGYEVCRSIRDRGLTDLRIIAMTGYGQERDRARAREAGFDTHTVNPVDVAELTRLVGTPTPYPLPPTP
jgi:CheY-like chemotaxis protein